MSWHLNEFNIEQFRGLQNVRLAGLGRINLLVGQNDSGKTSILEALSVFANPLDPYTLITLATSRERGIVPFFQPLVDALKWLFPQRPGMEGVEDYTGAIRMSATGSYNVGEMSAEYRDFIRANDVSGQASFPVSNGSGTAQIPVPFDANPISRGAEINLKVGCRTGQRSPLAHGAASRWFRIWENEGLAEPRGGSGPSIPSRLLAPFSHRFDSLSHRLSDARKQGIDQAVIDLMRQVDARVQDLEILSGTNDRAVIYVRHDLSGLTPLSVFGDGLKHALDIALTIPQVQNGLLLIDEIDAAIHTSALFNLFKWIVNACRQYNVQLFATTHSLEAVDALLETAPASEEFVLFRLPPMGKDTTALRLDQRKLRMLRAELGQEVR